FGRRPGLKGTARSRAAPLIRKSTTFFRIPHNRLQRFDISPSALAGHPSAVRNREIRAFTDDVPETMGVLIV
ncbi:MAG TPA: hypothetical protein VFT45_10930, partial [Longimicrobium sp.]|nr:hypothetical protein [Longimicrobium sp.]